MSFGAFGQFVTCSTPYFGPYSMASGSPCSYKNADGSCCDPTDTIFGSTPPGQPGSGGSSTVGFNYNIDPTRTCRTPFYSQMYGSIKLYTDILGLCDPTLTNTQVAGMDTQTMLLIGGIATLMLVMVGSGGGGSRRRR